MSCARHRGAGAPSCHGFQGCARPRLQALTSAQAPLPHFRRSSLGRGRQSSRALRVRKRGRMDRSPNQGIGREPLGGADAVASSVLRSMRGRAPGAAAEVPGTALPLPSALEPWRPWRPWRSFRPQGSARTAGQPTDQILCVEVLRATTRGARRASRAPRRACRPRVPPACAMSGRPPPEPPTICAIGRMRSPALNRSVSDFETVSTSFAFGPATAPRSTTASPSLSRSFSASSRSVAGVGDVDLRRASTLPPASSRALGAASRRCRRRRPPPPPPIASLRFELGDLLLELAFVRRAASRSSRRAPPAPPSTSARALARASPSSWRTYASAFRPVAA